MLNGGSGHNTVLGNSGDDTIIAGGGNDLVKGGTGFDTLDFSGADHGLVIDVSKGAASGFGDVTFSGHREGRRLVLRRCLQGLVAR